jgi:cytoplasmic iron level regulating protein YaaA (DUF328/UPF0246 family)
MAKIICISCVKSKRNRRSKASDLYTSPLFTKMLEYAKAQAPSRIFILSAEHGLLELDDEIEPYEKTLNTMKKAERQQWATKVLAQLRTKTDLQSDEFIFLAGNRYRELLTPHIKRFSVPMENLSFGRQLAWLTEQAA